MSKFIFCIIFPKLCCILEVHLILNEEKTYLFIYMNKNNSIKEEVNKAIKRFTSSFIHLTEKQIDLLIQTL